MPHFYDTHAHLDYPDYAADFPEVIARAEAAGITKLISIGTNLASSRRAIKLAEKYPAIYAAVGWHPSDALEAPEDLGRLPSTQGGSATDDAAYKQKQAEILRQQLEVAIEFRLNCVIHQRASFDDLLAQVQPYAAQTRGVFHCFGESVERLQQILALGWLVSYTGIVTFKNGQNIRDAVAATPLGKFMLETDCPYLAPIPYRGKRCEPAYVKEIADTVAQVKLCSLDELSAATCRTAREFFPKLV